MLPFKKVSAGNETQRREYPDPSKPKVEVHQTVLDPSCPGRAAKTIDPEQFETTIEWDPTCAFVVSTANPLGHTTRADFYGVKGMSGASEFKGITGSSPGRDHRSERCHDTNWLRRMGAPKIVLAPLQRHPLRTKV